MTNAWLIPNIISSVIGNQFQYLYVHHTDPGTGPEQHLLNHRHVGFRPLIPLMQQEAQPLITQTKAGTKVNAPKETLFKG